MIRRDISGHGRIDADAWASTEYDAAMRRVLSQIEARRNAEIAELDRIFAMPDVDRQFSSDA